MTKTAVVALGGNALTRKGQAGTCEEMTANAAEMAASVGAVIQAGWRVMIVHGNGPQIGNLTLQQEAAAMVPAQPLALLGAMTQGLLGSLITRAIDKVLGPGTAAAVVTHVTVDPADAAFAAPSKPIGPFFLRQEAQRMAAARGWHVKPDPGRGYRRVVSSPEPERVIEIDALRALADAGHVVIAGGGGIPVVDTAAGWAYADAVIDKDRAAELIASLLSAEALLLVTAVDRVMLDYGTPRQSELGTIHAGEAARYLADGQFPRAAWVPRSRRRCASSPVAGSWRSSPQPACSRPVFPAPARARAPASSATRQARPALLARLARPTRPVRLAAGPAGESARAARRRLTWPLPSHVGAQRGAL